MRLFVLLAVVLSLAAPAAQAADHKAGIWFLDVDDGLSFCMGAMQAKDGDGFLTLLGSRGAISVSVTPAKKMRRAAVGVIATDAGDIPFVPEIGKDNFILAVRDLTAPQVAMLGRAKVIRVIIDGAVVLEAAVENSGIEDVLTGAVACSNGESGWWGKGARVEAAADAGEVEPALHKDGFWLVTPSDEPGFCVAAAKVDDHYTFAVVLGRPGMSFGVSSAKDMRRGRKGRLQTDAYKFDFRPEYESPTYFYPADDLDSQGAFALRRARTVAVSVDGRTIIDMDFEGTGYAEVLADLAACADGEKGWWGEGAKQP